MEQRAEFRGLEPPKLRALSELSTLEALCAEDELP